MSESIANVNLTTDTFNGWLTRTNELATVVRTSAVTANSTLGVTTGNGYVNGIFSVNTLVAVNGLRGGNNSTSGTLLITSDATVNGVLSVGDVTVNGSAIFNGNVTFTSGGISSNGSMELSTVNVATLSANTIVLREQLIANGVMGANNEVLKSDGTNVYWGIGGGTGDGYTGSRGFTGSRGVDGYTGSRGFTGSRGDIGTTGFTGSRGTDGINITGFTGSQGPIGYTGSQGPIGFTGSQGAGFTGSASTVPGPMGYTGSAGAGFTGSRGDTGFTGSRGTNGTDGGTGFTGSRGYTGSGYDSSASIRMGSLGVGTSASGTTGEIRATNNITAYYSDDRLKTRLGNIQNALEKVLSLNGFYFEPNETAQELGYEVKREVGVSAQEVNAILPEIIAPAPIDEKYMTIHYEKLIPLLIEAIKELNERIPK